MRRRSAKVLAGVGLAICYFLFAGQFSIHELMAASFAWCVALSFSGLIRRTAGRPLEWTRRWAWVCGRVMTSVVPDAWVVAGVLSRAIWRRPASAVGTMQRQPFLHGTDRAADAGRRALVTLARSLAPKEFVVDIPEHGDWLWVHSLAPSPPLKKRKWPL
jgi:hypothetical protein